MKPSPHPNLRLPSGASALLLLLISAIGVAPAQAQRNCTVGIPCGNTCISRNDTCRIGTTPSPDDASSNQSTDTLLFVTLGCAALGGLALAAAVPLMLSPDSPFNVDPEAPRPQPTSAPTRQVKSPPKPRPPAPVTGREFLSRYGARRAIPTPTGSPAFITTLRATDVCTFEDEDGSWDCPLDARRNNGFRSSIAVSGRSHPIDVQAYSSETNPACIAEYQVAAPAEIMDITGSRPVSWSLPDPTHPLRLTLRTTGACALNLANLTTQRFTLTIQMKDSSEPLTITHEIEPVVIPDSSLMAAIMYPSEEVPAAEENTDRRRFVERYLARRRAAWFESDSR